MFDLNEKYETAPPSTVPDGVLQCWPPPAPGRDYPHTRSAARPTRNIQRIVGVVLLLLVLGSVFLYLFKPSVGSSGDGPIVAPVGSALIRQSDVDVQLNLSKAMNVAFALIPGNLTPDDVLNNMVYETLALADAGKHNYPLAAPSTVDVYINKMSDARIYPAALDAAFTSYGLSRSVLSDTMRTRLTIDSYINERVIGTDKAPDQRNLLINNWKAALYDPQVAQISYPNKLRDDNGPAAKQGHPAPEIAGTDLNTGKPIKLSDLKRHPVLVNFWATWCVPCKTEMPEIVAAYNKYRDSSGLEVLAVSIEGPSAQDKISAFMRDNKMTFPTISDDDNLSLSLAYHVASIPTSAFVDRSGIVQWMQLGAMSEEQLASGLDRILK